MMGRCRLSRHLGRVANSALVIMTRSLLAFNFIETVIYDQVG
ncbi:unnamed protein product [Acidithrix sp. C25]|nr:unnamed protein product [Acidithrix sp. C25]